MRIIILMVTKGKQTIVQGYVQGRAKVRVKVIFSEEVDTYFFVFRFSARPDQP